MKDTTGMRDSRGEWEGGGLLKMKELRINVMMGLRDFA